MLRISAVLLLAMLVGPVCASDESEHEVAALEAAIRFLRQDGHHQVASQLDAMRMRITAQRVEAEAPQPAHLFEEAEAGIDDAHKERVESLFDFILARDGGQRVDLAQARRLVRSQERKLALLRESARRALEAENYDQAAAHSREAAKTRRILEATRARIELVRTRPTPDSDAGLSARLEQIEKRLERIEALLNRNPR